MAAARTSRPLRRGFGLVSLLVASADIAAVAASSGGSVGNPAAPAAAASDLPMLAYGCFLLLVGLWCISTSFADEGPKRSANSSDDDEPAIDAGQERAVIHALRDFGWYVADDIHLPHGDVDHVAIGPAGVLAVQVQWTNRPDSRGKPAARARIAAQQLRKVLAAKELAVEVVPVVLAFGPGLDVGEHGVKVVDTVAILNGYCASQWMSELDKRALLPDHVVDSVRTLIGDLRESGVVAPMRTLEPAFAS